VRRQNRLWQPPTARKLGPTSSLAPLLYPRIAFYYLARMSRRPASITQADVARVIRAAKATGAAEVEVRLGEQSRILIRLHASEKALDETGDIVL